MATYVIGDVQGCFSCLQDLLRLIAFDRTRDRLWFTGDVVNRGPHSLEVLRFVISLGHSAVMVLGNHDIHVMMRFYEYAPANDLDTLDDILAAPDVESLVLWLRHCPLLYIESPFVLVHAGILPCWSVAQASALAREVEALLQQDDRCHDVLQYLYGSNPTIWHDQLSGMDRVRVIVNSFSRLRFCTPSGEMEFRHSGAPHAAPRGFSPWFKHCHADNKAWNILFGHWSQLGLYRSAQATCLDTACLWGGKLTALCLENQRIFQVQCAKPVMKNATAHLLTSGKG